MIGSATSLANFPLPPASSAEVARAAAALNQASRKPPVALGRVTAATKPGTMGLTQPAVALGRVVANTKPGTMGLGGAGVPYGFARAVKPSPSSGGGCVEPPSAGTMPDGRPKRDLVLVAQYLACLDRRAAAAAVQPSSTPIAYAPETSPTIVPGSPVIVPSALVSAPSPTFAAPVLDLEAYAPSSSAAVASSAAFADSPAPSPSSAIVASTFGGSAHVEAPDWAWIAGGVLALGLGAVLLRKKGLI